MCPDGTLYNPDIMVCDWPRNVECDDEEVEVNKQIPVCEDINECENNPCVRGNCHNTIGSYECDYNCSHLQCGAKFECEMIHEFPTCVPLTKWCFDSEDMHAFFTCTMHCFHDHDSMMSEEKFSQT